MAWDNVARAVQEETGTFVDWDEEFFICPECGEPIYKCDWQNEDYFLGHFYTGSMYCPVCENIIAGEGLE